MSIKGFQIGEGSVQKYDYTELDNKPTVPVVDATLTTTGAAADAKKTGDEIENLKSAIDVLEPTASSFDVGKVLKAKSVSGGKVTEYEFDSVSEPTDEQVADAVTDWLEDHPEATTTVQDGSITIDKLSNDVKQAIENAGTSVLAPSNVIHLGAFMDKPNGNNHPYVGWPFYDVQYDPSVDKVVFLVNDGASHGDNPNYDLYVYRFDPRTYEIEQLASFNHSTEGHGMYSCGFCIDSDENYIFVCTGDGDSYNSYIYKSTDKGETWTSTTIAITAPFGLMQLSNGRYICHDNSQKGWIYYSSDLSTWTKTTISNGAYENCIIELDNGNLICLGRKSWQSTDNDSWNGNKIKEPAIISYSSDYGTTWSAGIASTSITEMSADNCCGFYHASEGLVELFVTSRYPHLNAYGICYQYIAKLADAKNDRWGEPKVLFYAKAKTYQDFGYIGGCKDSNGDMHIMYYDGDSDSAGSANYYYMKASRRQAIIPINADTIISPPLSFPYSAKSTDKKLKALKSQLMAKINQIIIDGGGEIDDEGDGSFYITDGLYDFIDFTNLEEWDSSTGKYTGSKSKIVMEPDTDSGSRSVGGGQNGAVNTTICPSIPTGDLSFDNGVSIEVTLYIPTAKTDQAGYRVIGTNRNSNSYTNDVGVHNAKQLQIPYKDTNNTAKTLTVGTNVAAANRLYQTGYQHIVLIRTDSYAKVYLNGQVLQEKAFSEISDYGSPSYTELTSFTVAGIWSQSDALFVKTCRVYSKALTADDVTNNYTYETNLWANAAESDS